MVCFILLEPQLCLCLVLMTDGVIFFPNNRPRPRDSRGSLHVDQEGCCRPQASWEEPQGQGLQVPSHSHRVPYPPSQQVLQDRWCSPSHLEVVSHHSPIPSKIQQSLTHVTASPPPLPPLSLKCSAWRTSLVFCFIKTSWVMGFFWRSDCGVCFEFMYRS